MKSLIRALLLLATLYPLGEASLVHFRIRSPKGSGRGGGGGGSSRGHGGSSGGGKGVGAGTGRGGSGDTGHPSISSASSKRSANYFSGGGGKPFTLPSGNVFAGREMGGGTREQVPGTARMGSGYPYYVNNPQTRGVYLNPFPFGFWPVYWYGHGYSEEYGYNRSVADERPGGALSMVNLAPAPGTSWNTSAVNGINETYWMVGDQQTVTTMLSLLVDPQGSDQYACGVQNNTIQPFNSTDPALPFHFENVMQWYRSSSYALAYTGYNNTYALSPLNETTPLDQSTPLPQEQMYSPFLHCINNTLVTAVAILDGNPQTLTGGEIAGIVIGAVAGAIILAACIWYLLKRRQKTRFQQSSRF
jgi:hypothetical protein